MGDTSIEWTDKTWNCLRGCSRVSPGCQNCYAERIASRFSGPGQPFEVYATREHGWTRKVGLIPEKLEEPLSWRKPRRIFVNSMSDFFHEDLYDNERDQMLAVMLLSPRHTYQVLTKRADVMRRYLSDPGLYDRVLWPVNEIRGRRPELTGVAVSNPTTFPPRWIWWGVSVEDQERKDRIDDLRKTPAALRFLSLEPLLEDLGKLDLRGIGWAIVGGESGAGARPMHPQWARAIRDQCVAAGVPFFFKQWGHWAPYVDDSKFTHGGEESWRTRQSWMFLDGSGGECWIYDHDGSWTNYTGEPPATKAGDIDAGVVIISPWGKKAAGRNLDGRTWDEFPEVRRCV